MNVGYYERELAQRLVLRDLGVHIGNERIFEVDGLCSWILYLCLMVSALAVAVMMAWMVKASRSSAQPLLSVASLT